MGNISQNENYLVKGKTLIDICDAVRGKTGSSDAITISALPSAITQIPSGGGGDITVVPLNVSANGTYSAAVSQAYSPVNVSVPEPSGTVVCYGEVGVSTGANVKSYEYADIRAIVGSRHFGDVVVSASTFSSQTSTTITSNGTYNTTYNNQATVDIAIPNYVIQDGDTISTILFPTQEDDIGDNWFNELQYDLTDPDLGFKYCILGLELRVADLSSIGLGNGYLLYHQGTNGNKTPVYSTIAFDGSAYVPGFKAYRGWLTSWVDLSQPTTVDYSSLGIVFEFALKYGVFGKPISSSEKHHCLGDRRILYTNQATLVNPFGNRVQEIYAKLRSTNCACYIEGDGSAVMPGAYVKGFVLTTGDGNIYFTGADLDNGMAFDIAWNSSGVLQHAKMLANGTISDMSAAASLVTTQLLAVFTI